MLLGLVGNCGTDYAAVYRGDARATIGIPTDIASHA